MKHILLIFFTRLFEPQALTKIVCLIFVKTFFFTFLFLSEIIFIQVKAMLTYYFIGFYVHLHFLRRNLLLCKYFSKRKHHRLYFSLYDYVSLNFDYHRYLQDLMFKFVLFNRFCN
jgi:hypothetical protein